jgi:hypothetical protein
VLEWWRIRRRRRAEERWARADGVRRAAFGILQRLARPLEERNAASLVWVDDQEGLVLRPASPWAAPVGLYPGPDSHGLLVGPEGNLHEVPVRGNGSWRDELEACLRAVIEGGYAEEVSEDRCRLRMTFALPGGEEIVARHAGAGGDGYGEPGVHRYAAYDEADDGQDLSRG